MEWFQWLQSHLVPVLIGVLGSATAVVIAIIKFFDAIKALWARLIGLKHPFRGKAPSASPSEKTSSSRERSTTVNNPRASGDHSVNVGNMNQPLIFWGNVFGNWSHAGQGRRAQQRAARQLPRRAEKEAEGQYTPEPATGAISVDDVQADGAYLVTLPVDGLPPTSPKAPPQETPAQAEDDGANMLAAPLAVIDGSAEPYSAQASATDAEMSIEAESTGQEDRGREDQQASVDTRSPTCDDGAKIEVGDSTGTGLSSEIALVDSSPRVDERQTSSVEAGSDADFPTPDEAAGAHDETLAQGDIEEVAEPTRHQDSLPGYSATERLDSDSQHHANAGGTASIPEAIPITQLTTPADERESAPTLSAEQGLETDLSVPSSTQTRPVEVDHVDRDIGDIADQWSVAVIGATLQRLRHARGLLPTDLSYDPGWIIAFEAGRWHTRQTERQRYVRGIRTYLRALGVTPRELRELLSLWTAHA